MSSYSPYYRSYLHPSVYQFILIFWCWTYDLFVEDEYSSLDEIEKGKPIRYCYDNVYADIDLNGGDEPSGIYGWVDVYTMEGFITSQYWGIIKKWSEELLFNTIYAIVLTIVFAVSGLPLCTMGEKNLTVVLWFYEVDLCSLLMP